MDKNERRQGSGSSLFAPKFIYSKICHFFPAHQSRSCLFYDPETRTGPELVLDHSTDRRTKRFSFLFPRTLLAESSYLVQYNQPYKPVNRGIGIIGDQLHPTNSRDSDCLNTHLNASSIMFRFDSSNTHTPSHHPFNRREPLLSRHVGCEVCPRYEQDYQRRCCG